MKKLLPIIFLFFSTLAYANLTNTRIPVTKNGAANPPQTQDGSITDTGTSSGIGNVGIGSANPGQQLDVNGTVRAVSFVAVGGTSSQFLKADGSKDSTSYGTGTVTNVSASSPLASSGGTTPNITVNSSTGSGAIVLQVSPNLTPNVGIGSSMPGSQLDIQGTTRIYGNIGIAGTPTDSLYVNTQSNGLTVNGLSSGQSNISQTAHGSSDQLGAPGGTVTNLGQIFTTSASGTVTSAAFYINSTGGSPTGNIRCQIQTTSGGKPAGTPTGSLVDANATVDVVPSVGAENICTFPASFSLAAGTYALVLVQVTNQSSGNYWSIGLTSPSPGGAIGQYVEYFSGAWQSLINNAFYLKVNFQATNPGIVLSQQGSQLSKIQSTAADNMLFQDSGSTTKMALVSGNLGIGSTAPGALLDVQGSVRTTGLITGSTVGATCSGSPTASFATINGIVTHC